jgi:tetratricopeptide (TPR) repeat protein
MSIKKNQFQNSQTKTKVKHAKSGAALEQATPNRLWLPLILLLTLIIFIPAFNNGFTNWDDPTYILDNPLIRQFNFDTIRSIFSEPYFGNYQPLHILSYAFEYQLYQLNPVGYHVTSVIMHLITTALVYRFIFLLCGNSNITIISTLLFGIHPMHVESIAWAAERKDMLYASFFLGALIMYLLYLKSDQKLKYLIFAFLLFSLSILSKAMASSLPPVLILIDFYYKRKFNSKLVMEKIPFFALAIVFGLISAITASTTGQVSLHVFNLFERIIIANFNLLTYCFKLLIPFNFSAFYPYPQRVEGMLPFYFYIAPFIVIALAILIFKSVKKTRVIIFGAGFFVACIILVLQLFPVGPTIISERYTYLPSIGFFFVCGYFIDQIIRQKPGMKTAIYFVLSIYCLYLSVATYKRNDVWKDSISLWTNVLNQFPHVGTALNNIGNVYGKERGDLDKALEYFNKSIQYDPGYENAYANRGIVFCMKGNLTDGIRDFSKAIELKPGYYDALVNRGIAYYSMKEYDKSIADFNTLIATKPNDAVLLSHRGWSLLQAGKNEEALNDFNRSITIDSGNSLTFLRRSNAFYNLKLFKDAFNDLQKSSSMGMQIDSVYFQSLEKAASGN